MGESWGNGRIHVHKGWGVGDMSRIHDILLCWWHVQWCLLLCDTHRLLLWMKFSKTWWYIKGKSNRSRRQRVMQCKMKIRNRDKCFECTIAVILLHYYCLYCLILVVVDCVLLLHWCIFKTPFRFRQIGYLIYLADFCGIGWEDKKILSINTFDQSIQSTLGGPVLFYKKQEAPNKFKLNYGKSAMLVSQCIGSCRGRWHIEGATFIPQLLGILLEI